MPRDDKCEKGHALLERWGKWMGSRMTGWPTKTLLARVIEMGAVGAGSRGAGTPVVEIPPDVERTELAVCAQPARAQRAMRWYYVAGMRLELIGRRMRRPAREISELLRNCRRQIAEAVEKAEEKAG